MDTFRSCLEIYILGMCFGRVKVQMRQSVVGSWEWEWEEDCRC